MMITIPPKSTVYMKANPHSKHLNNATKPSQLTTPSPLPLLQLPPKPNISISPPQSHIKSLHPMKNKKKHTNSSNPNATVIDVLCLMDSLQLSIPQDVYAYLLKECTDLRDADAGAQVHSHITQNAHPITLKLANRLLHMYVSTGRLDSAHHLFDQMIVKDSVSWISMIAGHVDHGYYLEALTLFKQMQQHLGGLLKESMWGLIINCVLHACLCVGELELGKQVHGLVLKMKKMDLFIGSLFINFYGKLGCVSSARRIFEKMSLRDTVVWTSMIVVYSREENFEEVLEVFKEMGREGTNINNFTLSSVIRACGRMGNEENGRQVHGSAIKLGLEMDKYVQCSLVDMYGKCGILEDARRAFEMTGRTEYMNRRNDACWNAMLTGYVQSGFYNEAIKFLYQMKSAGVVAPESLLDQVRVDCVN